MKQVLVAGAFAILLGAPAFAQDSVQNAGGASEKGGTAASQSAAASSVVPASMVATGSVVVGASVAVAGHESMTAGVRLAQDAKAAGRFAEGKLPVDKTVVLTPQSAPKVPYQAQTNPAHPEGK